MDKIIVCMGGIVVGLTLLLAAIILIWAIASAALELLIRLRDLMSEFADRWKRGEDPDE